MLNLTQSQGYAKIQHGIKLLMQELKEAEMYGDNVGKQIAVLSCIIDELDTLIGIVEPEQKPWEKIGISRSTWYRDQKRAKSSEPEKNSA